MRILKTDITPLSNFSVNMEVKIPREVRKYHESIVFGLSMRQFICSAVAVGIAILAYFGLRPYLGNEGVSWVCIFVALPVALIGFVTYHEMTLEHFVWAWLKSEFLMPKRLYFKADNYMYMVYKEQKNEKATKNNKEV
jgi:hypothetical protein